MRKSGKILVVVALNLALLALSGLVFAKGGSAPAPPPPVLCGCKCPDGSFVTTHAPDANSCPSACAAACPSDM